MGQVGNPGQAGGMVPTERWSTAKGPRVEDERRHKGTHEVL